MLKPILYTVFSVLIVIFALDNVHAESGSADNHLVYAYYISRAPTNYMPVVNMTTTGCTLPAPASKESFTYTPVIDSVTSCDASTAKPIGVGAIAQNGRTIDIDVDVGPFEEGVDISFAMFSASFDASNIFFLNVSDQITSLQDEFSEGSDTQISAMAKDNAGQDNVSGSGKKNFKRLIPWKNDVLQVRETVFSGDISDLPPGLYVLVLNVTRSSEADNNYDRFYRWITYFIVPASPQ